MSEFIHPMENIVREALTKYGHVDVWIIAPLLGSPSHPPYGARAYEIVAQDILEVMTSRGVLERVGPKPKARPGGCYYKSKGEK